MAVNEVIAKLGEYLLPLADVPAERRLQVLSEARVLRVGAGNAVFQEGARDNDVIYVVKGSVDTFSGGKRLKRVEGGSEAARYPLPDDQPRKVTAQAASDVGLLLIPRRMLAPLIDDGDGDGLEVRDIDDAGDTGDWMTMLLRSQLYAQLPAANIQRIMATMESLAVKPGDVIVRQGEVGDYFYFLSRGRARVVRQARDGEPPVMLAELGPGTSFGEEALVAGVPRNATVTMTTEGRVMRLAKQHFEELILEPTVRRVSWVEAETMVHDGAHWLDVRFPDEHDADGLDGSENIPLGMLRMRMAKMDRSIRYVVYCDNGQRSAAGAFLMAGAGFDVYLLEGGITTPGFDESLDEASDGAVRGPFGTAVVVAAPPRSAMAQAPEADVALPEPGSAEADLDDTESTRQDTTVHMVGQLRANVEALEADKRALDERIEALQIELSATRDALAGERQRARDLARDTQRLRQTLTDLQHKARAALQHERSTYERELGKAVENLEQALLEKEMELEVERARSQEEIARLRRLIGGNPGEDGAQRDAG